MKLTPSGQDEVADMVQATIILTLAGVSFIFLAVHSFITKFF